MKLNLTAVSHEGKEKSISSNEGMSITLKHKNKIAGILAFEIWGQDTTEPFYALMWYPEGDLSNSQALKTQGKTITDEKWNCKHEPKCDEKDITFCIDNIPF